MLVERVVVVEWGMVEWLTVEWVAVEWLTVEYLGMEVVRCSTQSGPSFPVCL